jgi:ribosomal protein S20
MEEAKDVASARREAGSDAQTLEAAAWEIRGSIAAEDVRKESHHLSEVTEALDKVAREATAHLQDVNKKKEKLETRLEGETSVHKRWPRNYGITGEEYKPPLEEYKPPLDEYRAEVEKQKCQKEEMDFHYNRPEKPSDEY